MSANSEALYRGRVSVRPWRVGVLVSLDDEAQVSHAISLLSKVWGGKYMPLLDSAIDSASLHQAIDVFDLDSIYAVEPSDDLKKILQQSRCVWRGIGEFGPFSSHRDVHTGLVPWSSLVNDLRIEFPEWSGGSWPPLPVTAYLGTTGQIKTKSAARLVEETTRQLTLNSNSRGAPRGFVVLREGSPRDTAGFWNMRSLSDAVFPLVSNSADFNEGIFADAADLTVFESSGKAVDAPESKTIRIAVYGLDDLEGRERKRLEAWAKSNNVEVEAHDRDTAFSMARFPGLARVSSTSFRVKVGRTANLVPIDIPKVPLSSRSEHFPGIVAAEVEFVETEGVDPRLTVDIPPHSKFSPLIERLGYGADQARSSSKGMVFGVQANLEELSVPNAYRIDVMRLLFDEEAVKTDQSDEGKFQTRAAEMFGGPFSGHLNQPGVRAAIKKIGSQKSGMPFAYLKQIVEKERGAWPDSLALYSLTPQQYAERQVQVLLNSGLLVPYLQIQCHSCRITLRVSPEQLSSQFKCEFCGEDVRLALALALTKTEWRYRLAGYLSSQHVEAFLPAMAATGVLAHLHHTEGTPASHLFGLEVQLPGRNKIEVDVATLMSDDGWVAILGEVKNGNRIDSNDTRNLFELCDFLSDKGVVAIPMFATLKEEFSEGERELIREGMETSPRMAHVNGRIAPLTPLLLTRRDMSLPYLHDEHPWRWPEPGQGLGLIGVAAESCKRNLGLEAVYWTRTEEGAPRPAFRWQIS